jgi:hypothetical protein
MDACFSFLNRIASRALNPGWPAGVVFLVEQMPDQSPERDKHESSGADCHRRNQRKSKGRLHMKLSHGGLV